MLSESQKKAAIDALEAKLRSRGVQLKCPICGGLHFALADGYFGNSLHDNFSSFNIGGPMVPSIPVVCTSCGFISQHAIGVLGLKVS